MQTMPERNLAPLKASQSIVTMRPIRNLQIVGCSAQDHTYLQRDWSDIASDHFIVHGVTKIQLRVGDHRRNNCEEDLGLYSRR